MAFGKNLAIAWYIAIYLHLADAVTENRLREVSAWSGV